MHAAFGTKALVTRVLDLSMRVLFVEESPQMNSKGRRDRYLLTYTGG